ncbi:MAG TPA: response regulator [Casimicrobiaceae bacterium]|nr:response regulator [Casimicrobiaceae bacterium]
MQSESIPTVFLVDDSAAVRERLKELFDLGPRVRIIGEADTAGRAIVAIKASQPDFVVLDHKLPDGTGLDVLRGVRNESRRSCFIVLTNRASAELQDAFVDAGARFFLDKSQEFGRLAGLIAELSPANGKRFNAHDAER